MDTKFITWIMSDSISLPRRRALTFQKVSSLVRGLGTKSQTIPGHIKAIGLNKSCSAQEYQ